MKTLKENIGKSNILDMQNKCKEGEGSALVWLDETQQRIAEMDQAGPKFNAVLEWNPDAEGIANALDHEFKMTGARSPLHGIPVLLKDNIDTGDGMHTSAGSLALSDRFAYKDSFVAARLRDAGAVICGKANMSELANFLTENMPNGYSSRGGRVRHAWKEDADPWGSSTGSAVAVALGYVPFAIGTETCGSIISPACAAGVVGLKPTVGSVSRSGIIPISPSQDTAGPIARTVADCALVYSIIAGYDPEDPVTGLCKDRQIAGIEDCKRYESGLKGVRLGLYDLDYEDKKVEYPAFLEALRLLEDMGAEIVPFTPSEDAIKDMDKILVHEFRPAMDAALRRGTGNVRSMADIAAYNSLHAHECLRYGQTWVEKAVALQRPMLAPEYLQARQAARKALMELEQSFAELSIDAVISPLCHAAFPATGCPSLALPVGVDEAKGLPVSLVFNGLPFSESKLLGIGAALEAALGKDIRPSLL